jgi:hypothetical protein
MTSYTVEELLALVIEYKGRPEAAWYAGGPKDFVEWIEHQEKEVWHLDAKETASGIDTLI